MQSKSVFNIWRWLNLVQFTFPGLSFCIFDEPYFCYLTDLPDITVIVLLAVIFVNFLYWTVSPLSFCFILLSSFLSHHGKHSREWCCLTIKAYMYILQISPWQNYRLILYYWIQADNWQADAMRLKKCILPKNIDDSLFMFLRGLN